MKFYTDPQNQNPDYVNVQWCKNRLNDLNIVYGAVHQGK